MPSRKELANAIRVLSIYAIEKAKSGHPGAPMGMADIAEVLWRDYLNHNPSNPNWINRDRFVLSNGHGSMLLYSLLHLSGYDLTINEIKNFRQLYSKTPGHPEYRYTAGVESTTGPLGQGLANAVGFAIAERTLAEQFNRPNHIIINHYTYVFIGDGCLMEGISHEVCSLAGTLKLGKLIVFYDKNDISIDGFVKDWFTDNTKQRFESYLWHVISDVDGHNSNEISKAIIQAQSVIDKPSLIICKTIIGFGSPNKAGTNSVHGSPLGEDEIILTCKNLQWKHKAFFIPEYIYDKWDAKKSGKIKETEWQKKFIEYSKAYPKLSSEFKRRINRKLPMNWESNTQKFIEELQSKPADISSRQASQNSIEFFSQFLPEYIGGSADLTPSNLTTWSKSKSINKNKSGNYIHYGVREFGMTAIANGIAIYGGFIPYTATFLIFMEYARNAIRMAALMKIHHIMVYTHDSILLGEDGPTHQPIEQLASLRTTPNMIVWRPCDQVESAVAWKCAIEHQNGPSALIFSRQNLKQQSRNVEQLSNIKRGGYILKDCCDIKQIQLIIIATGSEVDLAVQAYKYLTDEGYQIRVVSMPSTNIFDKQDVNYRNLVLPKKVLNRVVIEAGTKDTWYKYTGLKGYIIGLNTFGESAPAEMLYKLFGFTIDNIITKLKSFL